MHKPCAVIPVYNHEGAVPAVVADLRAVAPFVSANWSFSYDHYQVPTPRGSQAPHQAYLRYVATGQVD